MKMDQLSGPDHEKNLPARVDKTIAWLTNSRDAWKEKCKETKLQLKRQTFAVKRIKESRDSWKLSNIRLKHELSRGKQEITSLQRLVNELESKIDQQKKENNDVKKKY